MASTDARPIPQKNVAYRITFPIYDADGDLVTGATGLDSEVSKDGGTFADCTNEATEIATSSGIYYLDLTSTEMNADTVAVIVKTTSTGAKTTVLIMYPEEEGDVRVNVTAFGGTAGTFASGRPEVNTTHAAGTAWGSGAITAGSIASNAITAAKIATDAITAAKIAADAIGASELAADAVAEIADAIWDEATSGHTTAGTTGKAVIDILEDTSTTLDGKLEAIDDYVDTEVAAIKAKTDLIPASPAATSDIPSAASVADAVWDEARAGHVAAGSFGEGVKVESLNTQAKADVNAEADTALSDYDAPTHAELISEINDVQSDIAGLNDPTAAAIADAVWDEATLGHTTSGTFGEQLKTDVDAILADTNELQTDVADGGRVDLLIDGIKAKTDNLPADPADDSDIDAQLATIAGYLDTEIAAIKAKTDNLPASPAATSDIPTAAAIADQVWEEALADHSGTAGSTAEALDNAGGGASPSAIADAVWDERLDDHLSDRSFGAQIGIHIPFQFPEVDYKKIKGLIDGAIKAQKPVEVDLMPISEGLQAVITEIRAIDIPKAEKADFGPVLEKMKELDKAVKGINIPEIDLSPIENHLSKQDKAMTPQVEAVKASLEQMLERIRRYFDSDMEAFKKEVASIKEVFEQIPYVVMEVKDKPKPTHKEDPKRNVLDEYLKL